MLKYLSETIDPVFGSKIKSWLFRIGSVKEFIPLLLLKFCVTFNYSILAAIKDTMVVTAKGSGAEVIPVLKGGVVLIVAFLAMLLYSKLSNTLSQNKLFYTILVFFASFFLIYGFFLFPHQEYFTPENSAAWLLKAIGLHHKHWVAVYRNWIHSLFFIFAELWGGIMISLLFWGLANQITSMKNAAKFYIFYTAGGQFGTIVAGLVTLYYSTITKQPFTAIIANLMSIVLVGCIVIAIVYWFTNRYILAPRRHEAALALKVKPTTKLSLKQSLLFILRSKYLGLIALMVIGYGISINMVEVCWKAILKLQYPDPADYQAYMGIVQSILGGVSFIVALFVGGKIIRNYGWYTSAKLTPIILAITTCLFFAGSFLFPHYVIDRTPLLDLSLSLPKLSILGKVLILPKINICFNALNLLVLFGTIHGIACKTMKFCLFDTTKEMAYIPLDPESKVKGKAAVDLVGARFGKSGSSWTQLALIDLIGAGSILEVMHLLFPCILFILIFWFMAIRELNTRINQLQFNNPQVT